jgi:phosphatidate cytidylyltransferase
MAFNWQTFKTRTLTATIFVVVMLAGLLINRWTFFILFSVIHFGCWWEYLKLIEKIHQASFNRSFKLGLMLIGYGLMLWFCCSTYQIIGYRFNDNFSVPVSIAGFVLLIPGIFQKNKIDLKSFGSSVLGILYISLSLALMIDLWCQLTDVSLLFFTINMGYLLPLLLIGSLWINDTMAYIIGSLIGKTQMSKISPKKTWEGTIGGIILAVIVIGLVLWFINNFEFTGIPQAMILAAIASIAGTFGDLLESKLKRMANVKDSGHIMPGHGGFLDRFDSLLIATPFVWLYVYFFLQ